jgi:hypothetical protein
VTRAVIQARAWLAWPVALVASLLLVPRAADAQVRASYSKGQDVSPAFEGWEQNADGSFNIVFGYMNRNWEQKLHIPVGQANMISPGPADQGQPTYFLPRRNRFVFKVRVPADFGDKELVWTLAVNGSVQKAYGSLARDYRLDNVVIMSETGALGAGSSNEELRGNQAPVIAVEGEKTRTVRVGEPLELAALVTDDNIPRRGGSPPRADATPEQLLERALNQPRRITVGKVNGLHFAWLVYRGPGDAAAFEPAQVKTWEDTRAFANSPWAPFWIPPAAPEGNRWVTRATFSQPGTYVLRGRADDGGLFADVEVVVTVRP